VPTSRLHPTGLAAAVAQVLTVRSSRTLRGQSTAHPVRTRSAIGRRHNAADAPASQFCRACPSPRRSEAFAVGQAGLKLSIRVAPIDEAKGILKSCCLVDGTTSNALFAPQVVQKRTSSSRCHTTGQKSRRRRLSHRAAQRRKIDDVVVCTVAALLFRAGHCI
jgi:hypothetical protein